jgi:hypothetical protein
MRQPANVLLDPAVPVSRRRLGQVKSLLRRSPRE